MPASKRHQVAILAIDGLIPGDLATPCDMFGLVELPTGQRPYDVKVCSHKSRVKTQAFDLHTRWSLDDARHAQTLIVPGLIDPESSIPKRVIEVICTAHAQGARIASICTGAFVLAASGVLDGLYATTHWKAADLLKRLYPDIHIDPNVLFTDNGQVLTSAGAAAGIDLCLHMIKQDHGAMIAAQTARLAVVPLERSGGQAQFIVRNTPTSHVSLSPLLQWVEGHLAQNIDVQLMADTAAVSLRTLNRRFHEQLGVSPLQWVIQARVRRAQYLLEATDASIERVAADVGFGSAVSLRTHFLSLVGTSPTQYRGAFRQGRRA